MRKPVGLFLLIFLVSLSSFNVKGVAYPSIEIEAILGNDFKIVQRLPMVLWDNESKIVSYYDPQTDQWEDIAYPDGIDAFYFKESYTSESYLLYSFPVYQFDTDFEKAEYAGLFQPVLGEINPAPIRCGVIQDLPEHSRWIHLNSDDLSAVHFCHTNTGEVTKDITQLKSENLDCYNYRYYTNKNDLIEIKETNHILGITCDGLQVFVYSLDSGDFLVVGEIERQYFGDYSYVDLGESNILLWMSRWKDGINIPVSAPLYLLNLESEDSLTFLGLNADFSEETNSYYWSELDNTDINVYEFNLDKQQTVLWDTFKCFDIDYCFAGRVALSPSMKYIAIVNIRTNLEEYFYNSNGIVIFDTHTKDAVTQYDDYVSDFIWITDYQYAAVSELATRSMSYISDLLDTSAYLIIEYEQHNVAQNLSSELNYSFLRDETTVNLYDNINHQAYPLILSSNPQSNINDVIVESYISVNWADKNQIVISAYLDNVNFASWLVELDLSGD